MSRPRSGVLAVALALASAVLPLIAERPAPAPQPLPLPVAAPAAAPEEDVASPAPVPADVAAMLGEVSEDNIRRHVLKLVSFHTRNTLSEQDNPDRGIGAARDYIAAELRKAAATSQGRMTVRLQSFTQRESLPRPTKITNVVATLRGTQAASAGRTYVVSGHYDSRCGDTFDATCYAPGAGDDASGVAAIMEAARVMATRQFDATIVFMAVAGEEQGLFGSTHFAEQAKKRHLDIEGMFTNDIVGSSQGEYGQLDPHKVRVFSEGVPTTETEEEAAIRRAVGGENDSPSRQLARFVDEAGSNQQTDIRGWLIFRRDRYLRGGDHIPFLEEGYPAIRFTEPHEIYEHQHQDVRTENGVVYGDLPRFVDFPYVARVSRFNVASLAALAQGPRVPRDAVILAQELENDTTLEWRADDEPDLAGYEVVWRLTTEPTWTHSRFVGNVTRYTLRALSKDNFFVGVRAVDRDGNRSPVAFPKPSF